MSNHYKEFTEKTNPKHTLIKALKEKGHTNITVYWNGAMSFDRYSRGWNMKSDQTQGKKLAGCIESSLQIIKQMEVVNAI